MFPISGGGHLSFYRGAGLFYLNSHLSLSHSNILQITHSPGVIGPQIKIIESIWKNISAGDRVGVPSLCKNDAHQICLWPELFE